MTFYSIEACKYRITHNHHMKNIFTYLLLLTVSISAFGQMKQNIDQEALAKFKAKLRTERLEREARVKAYLEDHPSLQRITNKEDGSISYLKDIQFGQPVFVESDNKGAAETTGAAALSATGSFGVNLYGEGMKVYVWDGGYNLDTHQEFEGRTRIGDGNEFGINFHATHVMGTLIAGGIEDRARGMAPEAIGISYGFSNDLEEMTAVATTDTDFMILSNHSYGVRAGWNDSGTSWLGDEDVSDQEDWRFGYYNGDARNTDQLSYLAPYYLGVWSAGNQRGQGGNGPYPPNGPYDILVGDKNAKNTLIVGAINKINGGYNDISDVVMSSFSCWGPTDDGRIKPDIVGAGVSIYSTLEDANDDYGNLQGTSMSAPNVTGSLILIQELYSKLNAGQFMRSATLKSLIFHTANDGGTTGPDYAHGWGVLNASGMADVIMQSNNVDKVIRELELQNGETYTIDFEPAANTEVRATIVWTDLPGDPGPTNTLDGEKLMLINDLDMRISDGSNTYSPWILNPANPGAAATTGDNFRDNSEQIVFTTTDGSPQRLTIGHKGELADGKQAFSLVLTYTPKTQNETYYWIGTNGGSWEDGANWSLTSGGDAANTIPGTTDMVIFDDNSFTDGQTPSVTLTQNAAVGGIKWLSPEATSIALGGFKLSVTSDLILGSPITVDQGTIELQGSSAPEYVFNANQIDLSNIDLIVNSGATTWKFMGENSINDLTIQEGHVDLEGINLTLNNLVKAGSTNSNLNLSDATLNITGNVDFGANVSITDNGANYHIKGADVTAVFNELTLNGNFNVEGTALVSGTNTTLSNVFVADQGSLEFQSDLTIGDLKLEPGSSLNLGVDKLILVNGELDATGTSEKVITLNGLPEQPGAIQLDGHRKVCLDFLEITNVDVVGTASVTAGANSTSSNASWPLVSCENVLFADFTIQYTCLNSLTNFIDASTGGIQSWEWNFGDGTTSSDPNPNHVFEALGTYDVSLMVSDANDTKTYSQSITIGDNDLQPNTIVNNDGVLASQQQANTYQWYKDGQLIVNATQRTLNTENQNGVYFVVTFSNDCNLKSNEIEIIVSSIEEEIVEQFDRATTISPNPTDDWISISMINNYYGEISINLVDLNGKQFVEVNEEKTSREFSKRISVEALPAGVYLVRLVIEEGILINKKVLIK